MQIDTLLVFLFSSIILTISPGPDIFYVFYKTVSDGRSAAIKTVFGLTTGLFLHTFLIIIGFSLIIKNNQTLFSIIKFFIFSYFIFLSWKSIFQNKKTNINVSKKENNDFIVGLMMNLLNPKVSLFFIALFPSFIFSDIISIEIQFLILGIIFWLIATNIFLMLVFVTSRFKNTIQGLFENNRIKYVKAIVFFLIGIWIVK